MILEDTAKTQNEDSVIVFDGSERSELVMCGFLCLSLD